MTAGPPGRWLTRWTRGGTMHDEGEDITIGGWHVAEDISEWIEIAAIAVITLAVLTAFVVGARVIRTLGVSAAVEQIKQAAGCCSVSTC